MANKANHQCLPSKVVIHARSNQEVSLIAV
jgi:hypothetical protein